MLAWRGQDAEADDMLAAIDARTSGRDQPDDLMVVASAHAYVLAARGDLAGARTVARRMQASGLTFLGPHGGLVLDGLFAASSGDLAGTRAAIEGLAALRLQVEVVVACRRLLEAAFEARTGRAREAGSMYVDAVETLVRVGSVLIAVLGELDAVAVLPREDPASRRAIEHLRSFVASTGAVAIEQRLEERLNAPRPTPIPVAGEQPADQPAEAALPQNVRTTS